MQRKKILSTLLAVSMLLSCSTFAFASDGGSFSEAGTIYVGAEEAGTTLVSVQSSAVDTDELSGGALPARAEDMAASEQKIDKGLVGTSSVAPGGGTWNYLPNTFYVYNQITSYNCGPASVQAALRYINGSTPTQSTIATGCGTTSGGTYLSNMVTYINGQQTRNNYVTRYQQSASTMKSNLRYGVVSEQIAPIIGLAFSSSDGWLYSSGGHFMTVYGAMSDESAFALGDPWIGYSGSGLSGNPWSYSKSATTLYNAYSSVNIGYTY